MKTPLERQRDAWEQRTADWARLGFVERRTHRAYRIPKDRLLPGECACGAMLADHQNLPDSLLTACEALRRIRQSQYMAGGTERKLLRADVLQKAQNRESR